MLPEPICAGCGKTPDELPEYKIHQEEYPNATMAEIVRREEGTYNSSNGHFLCDECYIKAGMPSGPVGWIAP